MLVDKSKKEIRVKQKEDEKVEKYQNLARELRKTWEVKTNVIPIVLEALRTVQVWLKGNLKGIGVDTSIYLNPEVRIAGIY